MRTDELLEFLSSLPDHARTARVCIHENCEYPHYDAQRHEVILPELNTSSAWGMLSR